MSQLCWFRFWKHVGGHTCFKYNCLKSRAKDQMLQDQIPRIRLCGTAFISNLVVFFISSCTRGPTKMVGWKCFVLVTSFQRAHRRGHLLDILTWSIGPGGLRQRRHLERVWYSLTKPCFRYMLSVCHHYVFARACHDLFAVFSCFQVIASYLTLSVCTATSLFAPHHFCLQPHPDHTVGSWHILRRWHEKRRWRQSKWFTH